MRFAMRFLLFLLLLVPFTAQATVPQTMLFEGQLLNAAGQTAPDGKYQVKFLLYDQAAGGTPAWQEGPLDVQVVGGLFAQTLGQVLPLTADKLATGAVWLTMQVGANAELSRQALASVPFALRAQTAETLACTGCVTGAMLDASVLANYAQTKDLSQFATVAQLVGLVSESDLAAYTKTAALSTVAFSGLYSDLLGLPAGPGNLPPDAISTVSNGLMSNVFATSYAHSALELPIKDCYGLGVADTIAVPDVGLAQEITVAIDIGNSDISGLTVTLIDPNGQSWPLYDKAKTGTSLTASYRASQSGFKGWLGQNPKGNWQLKVVDSVCGPGGNDGAIHSWSVSVQALSAKQLQATGDLVVGNLLGANGLLTVEGAVTFGGAVSFQGTPIARVYTASADALADGATLDVVTGGTDQLMATSAWVQNGAAWGLIPGDAGATCAACGDGGEGDFTISSDTTLLGNDHQFSSLTIGAGATLTPKTADPLVIRVNGTVTIDGKLTLDGGSAGGSYFAAAGTTGPGGGAAGGAGGSNTYDGSSGQGLAGGQPGKGGGTGYNAGSGSGGGHAVAGGTSGLAIGGSAYGAASIPAGLEGGSGGGGGGGAGSSVSSSCSGSWYGGGGGGGGGAALLIAKQIVISATGKVSANGGTGGKPVCGYAGNGGGGSGGTIWLRANAITVDGTLSVNGGVLANTASGSPGRIRIDGPITGAWTPPAVADLATTGSFYQGSGVGPNPPYTISQPTPGTVRLTNHSGAAQNFRLVVLR